MSKARNLANFIGIPAINSSADATAITISSSEDISVGSAANHAGARIVINDTPPTAFGSPMFQIGQETFTASGYYSIGLGYTAGSYTEPPAEIAAVATSSSGGTTADIVFGTRSVTTNTAVTERMRINSSGNVGIGTASPDSGPRLHLSKGSAGTVDSHANSVLTIEDDSTAILQFLTPANEGIQLRFGDPDSNGVGLIEYGHGTDNLNFHTAGSERMRIDGSGKVGIGTTGPNQLLTLGSSTGSATIGLDFETSTTSRGSILYNAGAGEMAFTSGYSGYGGYMTFDCNGSERMRIDTSGRVGIGVTSMVNPLHVAVTPNTASKTSGSAFDGSALRLDGNINGANKEVAILGGANDNLSAGIGFARQDGSTWGTQIRFYTHGTAITTTDELTERMRIDANGNVVIGSTSAAWGNTAKTVIRPASDNYYIKPTVCASFNRTASNGEVLHFYRNGTYVGNVSITSSATSFNSVSDYRLKENIVDLDNAISRVKQIPVHRFNFIADPDVTVDGFLAHEVSNIVPEAVTGTKDAVDNEGAPKYQGIDQSKLVPLLTKAIQELEAKVAALEAK